MKKNLAILLCVVMILSVLVSCSKSGGGRGSNRKTDADDEYTTYVKGLAGEVNFDGMTFTYIGRSGGNFPIKDEETGDIGSDAVYHRQRDLEDIFGISWEPVIAEIGPDVADQVRPGERLHSDGGSASPQRGSHYERRQPRIR